jgi:integrase
MLNLGIVAGKRKRRAYYGGTQEEVLGKLSVATHGLRRGVTPPLDRLTVANFMSKWLAAASGSLRETTARRYEQLIRIHVLPSLGRTSLAKLGPADLQALYKQRIAAGAAPRTVLHVHRVLHRALSQAERWGDAARNVAALVDAPRVARAQMQALTAGEAKALMKAAESDRLAALLTLALATGMRQGELLGLRWQDLDLDAGAVRVTSAMQLTARGLTLVEPKTARSRRQIEVEPRVIAALRRHRGNQIQERFTAGPAWEDHGYVFCDEDGGPIDGRELLRGWFRPLLVKADLPRVRFHDLRHTYASIALSQGIHPKIVQEALGHSTIAVTLDLYSHTVPSLQRDAARQVGAALFGA